MNKQEQIILMVERLSTIYELSDHDKNSFYEKLAIISNEEFEGIVISLSDFINDNRANLSSVKKKIESTSIRIEELKEKKDFLRDDEGFFNNI